MFTVTTVHRDANGALIRSIFTEVASITDEPFIDGLDGGTIRVLRPADGSQKAGLDVSTLLGWEVSGDTPFVLYSANESSMRSGEGFWSAARGWTEGSLATVFCDPAKTCLPHKVASTGDECGFVKVTDSWKSYAKPAVLLTNGFIR